MTKANPLLLAALGYARVGVPVTAAYAITRRPLLHRMPLEPATSLCTCPDPRCGRPGEHPIADQARRITETAGVVATWSGAQPPNLMISPSGAIDLWDVPKEIGAQGMRLLEEQRISPWPPVMQASGGGWIFCTRALDAPAPEIAAHGATVTRLDGDALVLVPPSRRPERLRWVWSRRFPDTPLPAPWPMLAALASAAERLHPWEIRDEAARSTAPVGSS